MAKRKRATARPAPGASNKHRIRIKRLEFIKSKDLIKHEMNFRVHPTEQATAMRGVLEELGWVDAVLAFEEKGKLCLFDGHLRTDLEPEDDVPVLVTDLPGNKSASCVVTGRIKDTLQ